jgi:Asp-tRNA(Asn)/Glu-tRNA(Gln) amidotransferase A subunit family amidase
LIRKSHLSWCGYLGTRKAHGRQTTSSVKHVWVIRTALQLEGRTRDLAVFNGPYHDQMVWSGVATLSSPPVTVAPIDRSETGLPIGVQIVGPYLEDRTTIAFAQLIERKFGSFAQPPRYKG